MLGLHPHQTPLMAWMEATGKSKVDEDSEALRMGHLLEPVIRAEYEHRTGRTVTQPERYGKRHRHTGVLVTATADGLTEEPDGGWRGLECKSHVLGAADYGREGTDEVPPHEWIQCQVSMWASGFPVWDLAALVDNRVLLFTVRYDAARTADMVAAACEWWLRHVVGDTMPAPSGRELDHRAVSILWPGQHREGKPALRPAAEDESQSILDLRHARAALKAAEASASSIEQAVKLAIGDDDGLASIHGAVTWRRAQDRQVVDYEAALVDYQNRLRLIASSSLDADVALAEFFREVTAGPDLTRFTTTQPGSRRFLVPRDWSK